MIVKMSSWNWRKFDRLEGQGARLFTENSTMFIGTSLEELRRRSLGSATDSTTEAPVVKIALLLVILLGTK